MDGVKGEKEIQLTGKAEFVAVGKQKEEEWQKEKKEDNNVINSNNNM